MTIHDRGMTLANKHQPAGAIRVDGTQPPLDGSRHKAIIVCHPAAAEGPRPDSVREVISNVWIVATFKESGRRSNDKAFEIANAVGVTIEPIAPLNRAHAGWRAGHDQVTWHQSKELR
jgi:hypothetical protein